MRLISRRYGSPFALTGVLLDKIAMHDKAIKKLNFRPEANEHPVGAQILGASPDTMAAAAAKFESIGFDLIDLNFACPVPKVLRRGRGGALMQNPEMASKIFRKVREAVKCPVMMKLRIGFDSSDASREDFWRICEAASKEGVDALVIHGRTVTQRYRKQANWDMISEVKQRFPDTKVLGSGDVFDAETVVERLRTSGLDGLIIARGAIGNPWIFKESRELLLDGEIGPGPGLAEQGQVILEHFNMLTEMKVVRKVIGYFRKFSACYSKRHPQRKKVQSDLLAANTKDEFVAAVKKWYDI
jgi:nifR3 family TIM-barrel protein